VPALQDNSTPWSRTDNLQERASQAKAGLNVVRRELNQKMLEAE
jgi:hypothetical protein